MAKGNPLLGQMRGKVGDLVFSRTAGQQVVRARAAQVANPRTTGQMVQRIMMATIAQAYSRMSEITDHSFEGVQTGQKSMSYFMSKNLASLRDKLNEAGEGAADNVYSFCPIGSNIFAPNEYLIAKGSLPEINFTLGESADALSSISVATNTYQGVCDALGLQAGDQLTFCSLVGSSVTETLFAYCRVILYPSSGDMSVPFIVEGAVNQPNLENRGGFSQVTFDGGSLNFKLAPTGTLGVAVIASRKRVDGSWLRSNSKLTLGSWANIGYTLGECLSLLTQAGAFYGSDWYLNNANTQLSGAEVNAVYLNGVAANLEDFKSQDGATVNVAAGTGVAVQLVGNGLSGAKIVSLGGTQVATFTYSNGRYEATIPAAATDLYYVKLSDTNLGAIQVNTQA